MRLRTAHIVLISAAIALGVILLAAGVWRYTVNADATAVVLAVFGPCLSVGLALYLRYFVRKPTT